MVIAIIALLGGGAWLAHPNPLERSHAPVVRHFEPFACALPVQHRGARGEAARGRIARRGRRAKSELHLRPGRVSRIRRGAGTRAQTDSAAGAVQPGRARCGSVWIVPASASTAPCQAFPDSATSLLRLTGKGLTPLSSLSFSRSAFSAEPRRLQFRLLGVTTGRLPTPACVKRTCRALHPIGLAALVRIPQGDLQRNFSLRTRFESDGFAGFHGEAFPVRPSSRINT